MPITPGFTAAEIREFVHEYQQVEEGFLGTPGPVSGRRSLCAAAAVRPSLSRYPGFAGVLAVFE